MLSITFLTSLRAALKKRSFLYVAAIFLLASLGSCSREEKSYFIGIDPHWYALDLMGKEANVSALTHDLFREISRVEHVHFKQINRNWDNLMECVRDQRCQGAVTARYPHLFYLRQYHFSDVFLKTGPVLIVRESASLDTLNQLQGKEVFVATQAQKALLIQRYPGVIVRYYDAIPEALNSLMSDKVDAVLVDVLFAEAFIQNLYLGKLKIVTKPLNQAGLRIVTLRDSDPQVVNHFNAGLEKLRKNGVYKRLLEKWDLARSEG